MSTRLFRAFDRVALALFTILALAPMLTVAVGGVIR